MGGSDDATRDEADPDLVLSEVPGGWEARATLEYTDLCGRGATPEAALRDVGGRVGLLAAGAARIARLAELRALRYQRGASWAQVEVTLVPADRSPGPRNFPPRDGWTFRLRDGGGGGRVLVCGSAPDRRSAVERGAGEATRLGFVDVRVVETPPYARGS